MDFEICCMACDNCHEPFTDGDKLFLSDFEDEILCCNCVSRHKEPTYVYHQGIGLRIFQKPMPRGLDDGVYVLTEMYDNFIIRPYAGCPTFGSGMYLECRNSHITLLFSENKWVDWIRAEECITSIPAFRPVNPIGTHVLMDRNMIVYGYTDADTIDSVILSDVNDKEIKAVETASIRKDYDLSFYAKNVRKSLQKLDPQEMLTYCEHRVQGQELELKKAAYLVWQYLQSIRRGKYFQAFNWFLAAPSGCGKTEFFRTIHQYFKEKGIPHPVVQIDLSRITEEGFKGLDPSNIIDIIKNENCESNGYAICFLDETDKKLIPNYDGHADNVNKNVQSTLLTIIEGNACETDKDGDSKDFDTGKTMFVMMGAFQDLRKDRQMKASRFHAIGFSADHSETPRSGEQFYDEITIEDIISFGMEEELAGRILQVINFKRLSEDAMIHLLRCKTAQISEELRFPIELTSKAKEELLSISYGNLGVRCPLNKIREMALNTISAHFFEKGFAADSVCIRINGLDDARLIQMQEKSSAASQQLSKKKKKRYAQKNSSMEGAKYEKKAGHYQCIEMLNDIQCT